jgi:hypothetical protein
MRTVGRSVTAVIGSPARPLSPEAAKAKFTMCWGAAGLPPERGAGLWDVVTRLETIEDVGALARLCRNSA